MQSIEWCHFQLPSVTSDPDFKVTYFEDNYQKMAHLKDKVTTVQ